MMEETSTPTEMLVGLLGAPEEAGQCLRGFVCMPARNLWHLPTAEILGAYRGFLWMPSRPHRRQPCGWDGLTLGEPTQPSTSWSFPLLWRDKSHGVGIAQHQSESCQMLYGLQTLPGRCDMGEHSRALGGIAG